MQYREYLVYCEKYGVPKKWPERVWANDSQAAAEQFVEAHDHDRGNELRESNSAVRVFVQEKSPWARFHVRADKDAERASRSSRYYIATPRYEEV